MRVFRATENDEFSRIRTATKDGVKYFSAKDISDILGYSNSRCAVNLHVSEPNKSLAKISTSGGHQRASVINDFGVLELVSESNTCSIEKKTRLLEFLGITSALAFKTRAETEFVSLLEKALKEINISGIRQYNVDGKYRIDFYIPGKNIAVEYDESQHKYHREGDKERERYIKGKLGCRFVRLNYEAEDIANVMKVVKEVI